MIKRVMGLLIMVAMVASCASQKKIPYFQDVQPGVEFGYTTGEDIKVQVGDELTINVSSKNSELTEMFNLVSTAGSSSKTLSYTIKENGAIDFPVLGEIEVISLTREQIAAKIKEELISQRYVNDPVVTVEFENLHFYLLGEVSKPGQYSIEKNQTTILEAISMAGDLTIYGQRDKIYLTRDIEDKKVTYQLNLNSQDIYSSPAFYVQQNDMIYVEPNKVRSGQSTINGNTVKSTSFWMSLTSFIITLTLLFVN